MNKKLAIVSTVFETQSLGCCSGCGFRRIQPIEAKKQKTKHNVRKWCRRVSICFSNRFSIFWETAIFLFSPVMGTDSIFLGGKNVRDCHLCIKVRRFVEASL
jgi:hypothetical protein